VNALEAVKYHLALISGCVATISEKLRLDYHSDSAVQFLALPAQKAAKRCILDQGMLENDESRRGIPRWKTSPELTS